MKTYIFIGIIGVVILGYSFFLAPYTNTKEFFDISREMNKGQSEEYYQLREEMLTPKYKIQDTGITIILFSLVGIFTKNKGRLLSPSNKPVLIGFAIVLPFFTVAGYLFDLIQGLLRNEYPHWADSIGIPLMGIPFELIALLIWSLLHLVFIKEVKAFPISSAFTFKLNPWLMLVSVITLLIILYSIFYGQYWYALPGSFWLYYYLSIGVNRVNLIRNKKLIKF